MKEALIKLLKIKSIITIVVVGVFAYLSLTGKISAEQFLPVSTMVLTFYFSKKDDNEEK